MSPVAAFDRLSPALQYQIVHGLGFATLRPVQELAIDAILDGDNCVVLAPTAGGKTEAAFFPLLAAMDDAGWRPTSVLYLSPIRALLNNQEDRIARYAQLIGRRAFKWHGDTGQSQRRQVQREPADILLTTPESLEAMLMSPRVDAEAMLAGLRAVVVDEIHAFAGDDRGAHLSALLERLTDACGRDLQRIGLSATVGNPEAILAWLAGSSTRSRRLVDPPKGTTSASIQLDHVGSLANAAHVIQHLHPGRKRLVFADSRRTVEELGKLLLQRGVAAYVAHGSLSAAARRDAETAFERGQDCVIVATSALELGIDVGDLDHVLQIDSPGHVASFLQRMGRTGRRPGTTPNCTFLATTPAATLQAAALLELYARGYVEPVRPDTRASHVFAHQVLALAIADAGLVPGDLPRRLGRAACFAELAEHARHDIIATMLSRDILADHNGRLWLGARGEKLYGRANFRELYAVFSSPRHVTVLRGDQEIGTLDAAFLQGALADGGTSTFTLAGQAWRVTTILWSRGVCYVEPAEYAGHTRWAGAPRHLGAELCEAMRDVLCKDEIPATWSARARTALGQQRELHAFLRESPSPVVRDGPALVWWNFAGGAANVLLAKLLESMLGGRVVARNTGLTLHEQAGTSEVELRKVFAQLAAEGRPNDSDATVFAESARRAPVSKFEPCLPEALLHQLFAERLVDTATARRRISDACRVA